MSTITGIERCCPLVKEKAAADRKSAAGNKGRGGRPRISDEDVYDLLCLYARANLSWRDFGRMLRRLKLPSFRTVFRRYREWSNAEVSRRVFEDLVRADPHSKLGMVDSTFIKSKSGLKEAGGYGYKGRGSNVVIIINERSHPVDFGVYSAADHDSKTLADLLTRTDPCRLPSVLLADKAYDDDDLRKAMRLLGGLGVILSSHHRKGRVSAPVDQQFNQVNAKNRWKIERFNAWLKSWRHFSYRYESRLASFNFWLYLVFSIMILAR